MVKQIFGKNSSDKDNNEDIEYKPLEEHIGPREFFIIICLVIAIPCLFFTSDKSSVLYCDIPNDTCVLRTETMLGAKGTREVLPPSEIKDFYIDSHCRKNSCHLSIYIVDQNDEHNFLYNTDSFFSKYKKFKKAANDIKELLKSSNGSFEYDLIHCKRKQ